MRGSTERFRFLQPASRRRQASGEEESDEEELTSASAKHKTRDPSFWDRGYLHKVPYDRSSVEEMFRRGSFVDNSKGAPVVPMAQVEDGMDLAKCRHVFVKVGSRLLHLSLRLMTTTYRSCRQTSARRRRRWRARSHRSCSFVSLQTAILESVCCYHRPSIHTYTMHVCMCCRQLSVETKALNGYLHLLEPPACHCLLPNGARRRHPSDRRRQLWSSTPITDDDEEEEQTGGFDTSV